ncbi:hypothetical protein CBW16_08350 [Flavobacteriaceae bacterium JJC]|nr:hypothetical protein CBW16_08350 [Flavobacteriaceae bacterium JJC]
MKKKSSFPVMLGLNFIAHPKESTQKLLFLLLFCLAYPQMLSAQGTNCGSATVLTVNGACSTGQSITDAVQDGPTSTCGGTFRREGWYRFTLAGNTDVTITAVGNYNLAFQLISSSNNLCTGTLSELNCVNTAGGAGSGSTGTETLTKNLNAGTYFIKILNVGSNNDMTLTSLCITAPVSPVITSLSSNNGCAGSSLIITGTNLTGATGVTIGNTAVASYVVNSSTQITATVGAGTTGTVKVTTAGGVATSAATYTFNSLPAVTTVSGGGTFCGTTTITASGGTGGTIYFQGTTSGGTSTASPSSSQTVSASGTYYFRSMNASGCWGSEGSVVVTITPPFSAVAAAPSPGNSASGVCYQGPGAVNNIGWTAAAGAVSYDVYFGAGSLPGTLTANVTTNSYNTGTLLANTTYHWKVVPRNSCGITTGTPVTWSFTTAATPCTVSYCQGTITTPGDLYINSFQFVGTLNDNPSPNISAASGYSDFTNLVPVVKQPQGAVLNIVATALGSTGLPKSGYWKAWVDYDNNGTFSAAEQVYSLTSFSTESLTFGFVIPPTTPVGKYRFRLKLADTKTFDPCNNLTTGETEDYVFEVIADCSAKVDISTLADAQRCGTGTVTLSAKSMETGAGTGVRWYAAANGGTPLFDGENFTTTVNENTRTTYYVVAYNSTCGESVFRIPVTAIANEGPVVNFGSVPSFCAATTSGQLVTAANGKRLDVLLDEHFNSNLGAFQQSPTEAGYLDRSATYWENRPSPYIPRATTDVPAGLYEGLAPALSSGYTGGNFAISNTDYNRTGKLLNRLTLKNNLDTRYFDNLKLDFDLYYFTLITADTDPALINYFSVEYSTNGSTWINLQTIYDNQGNPNIWKKISIDLPPSLLNITTLKIRFSSYSYGKGSPTLFKESIAAIDNVKISGIKDESSLFSWSSPHSGILYKQDCTTSLLPTDKAGTICVKPSDTQFENNVQFSITATANFSNGCPAVGTITINNDAKIYNTTVSTDWGTSANWKPDNILPDATKCVVVKKPVIISPSTDGLAKNITVEPGGTLNINGSLKVTDWMKNNTSAAAVVVESDGSLVQVNEGNTINTGSITAKRTIKLSGGRQQYNYIMSPLEGQNLKNIYNGIDYVLYHNEANNFFYNSSGAYIKGRALAVKEPNKTAVAAGTPTVTATFTGYPTNGAFTYGIVNSNTGNMAKRGFNLVGNPYPSNMDLIEFYKINGGAAGNISATFHLWDNRANSQTVQMGDGYGQQAYAIFNAVTPPVGGTGILATGDVGLAGTNRPTQYIKMGQGFMTQSKVASQQLKFNNTVRTTDKGTVSFFGKGEQAAKASVDRYWLNMITPGNLAAQIAVVYFEGGNNAFTDDDSYSMGGSDALYSVVDAQKVSINGRSSFTDSDVVPLGTAHFAGGNYTLTIQDKEGIFATGQSIYLKDKQTGVLTDLSQGNYSFTANAGESAGRFEIVYKPEMVLATDGAVKEEIQVYRDGNSFVVKSLSKKINSLEVYDASGKLISTLQPNSIKAVIDAASLVNGMYLIKIHQNGEVTSRKVLK